MDQAEEIKQQLQLKLLMVECSRDDPIILAHMITLLEDLYHKNHMHVPIVIDKFLSYEKKRITPIMKDFIDRKRYELNLLLDEKDRIARLNREKHKEEEESSVSKKMSRTELIFGDSDFN